MGVSTSGIPYDLDCAYENSLYFKETTHAKQECGKVGGKVILYRAYQYSCYA
jgi:hypothetical protein